MKKLRNFVALDWRKGPDCMYFIFKDEDRYCRLDLAGNKLAPEHPTTVAGHWGGFEPHIKNLRFGFTTRGLRFNVTGDAHINWNELDDILWLFYTDKGVPMVCLYDQGKDRVHSKTPLSRSIWSSLAGQFNKIVGILWLDNRDPNVLNEFFSYPDVLGNLQDYFLVILDNGECLDFRMPILQDIPLTNSQIDIFAQNKGNIMTVVQNDQPMFRTEYYVFLKDGTYLVLDAKTWQQTNHRKIETDFPYLMKNA